MQFTCASTSLSTPVPIMVVQNTSLLTPENLASEVITIRRLRWLGHLCRMQELNPSTKLILLESQGKPKLRWLESVEVAGVS